MSLCPKCKAELPTAGAVPGRSVVRCPAARGHVGEVLEEAAVDLGAVAPVSPDADLRRAVRAYLGDGNRAQLELALLAAEAAARASTDAG